MIGVEKLLMKVPHVRVAIVVLNGGGMLRLPKATVDDMSSMLPSEAVAICAIGCFLVSLTWVCQKAGRLEEGEDSFECGPLLSRFRHIKSMAYQVAFEINTREIQNVMEG